MVSCFPAVWAPVQLSYFTATCSLVLCFITTIGNFLLILAVLIDPLRKLRTPFSYFLVNLAISDLAVGSIAMSTAFAAHLDEADGFVPPYMVTMIHLTYFISTTASVLSLAALCLDRFIAIRWPIQYRRSLRLSRCVIISISIWVFSVSVSMIYLEVGYIDYLMVFVHVSVVITFSILVLTYLQVYKTLRSRSQALTIAQDSNEEQRKEALRKNKIEKKVTRAFLYILGLFIASYAPAIIMIYLLQFCTSCSCDVRHVLRDMQFLFVSANSAMNPFVCGIRLQAFRHSILAVILCKKKKTQHEFNTSELHLRQQQRHRSGTVLTCAEVQESSKEVRLAESNESGP